MTFVKKGVVIPKGAAGDADVNRIYTPSVIHHNGMFYCYYVGSDASNIYRAFLAISKDGINFTKKGVVVPLGATGESDSYYVDYLSAIHHNGMFYLYYNSSYGAYWRISLAISKDGINFTKKGVVVPWGAAGEIDDATPYAPGVLYHNGMFYLYYAAYDGLNLYCAALAISKDGINFTKKGVVVPLGATGESDDVSTDYPFVVYHNGMFYCYYTAHNGINPRIALAISKDGINFTKKGVVVPLGATGDFDDKEVFGPSALYHNGMFYCYYAAYRAAEFDAYRIALAISKDGI